MCLSCRWIDLIIDIALKYHDLPPILSFLLSLFLGDVPLIGGVLSVLGAIALMYLLMRSLERMSVTSVGDDPAAWADSMVSLMTFIILMTLAGVLLGPLIVLDPWLPLGLLLAFGLFLLTGQSDTLISMVAEEGVLTLFRALMRPRR